MRFLILLFLFSAHSFAQDFTSIFEKTNDYRNIHSASALAKQIEKDFTSDENRVKAIFCWLTSNINYDLDEFYNPSSKRTSFRYRTEEEKERILQGFRDEIVQETIIGRKAVCEGFAQTFSKVCDILNIESEVIKGNARFGYQEIGKPQYDSNHAWNAVKINNNWIYIDATWGAGSVSNGKWESYFKPYYYDIPKSNYFKTHLPEKSVWKLKVGRITTEEFYNQPIFMDAFLESNVELIKPKTGILKKDASGKVSIQLKNATDKHFLTGFLGSNIAQKPSVVHHNGITTVSITPPAHAKECFFLIDKEVGLQFLIE